MEKPCVFIGSSTEGLRIAEALFACLSHDTKPKLWTHQLFLPGQYPMEALEKQLREHAFAILVASPDDQIIKRDVTSPAMRDNLLLEFGLFTGALGRKRAFFVCPTSPQIELPSDLLGIIMAKYDGARVADGPDEIAAAVQVPCQQIREIIREEWTSMQKAATKAKDKIRASEKGQAIHRLHGVALQLRDALVVVQRDAFGALSDENAFQSAKETAMTEVTKIADSFRQDAGLIGADKELEALSDATAEALADLPFPRELAMGKEAARQKVIDTGFGALNSFLGGGDPVRHVQNVASEEADMRIAGLKNRYVEWWDQHYPHLQEATLKLQDKLMEASLDLNSEAYTN